MQDNSELALRLIYRILKGVADVIPGPREAVLLAETLFEVADELKRSSREKLPPPALAAPQSQVPDISFGLLMKHIGFTSISFERAPWLRLLQDVKQIELGQCLFILGQPGTKVTLGMLPELRGVGEFERATITVNSQSSVTLTFPALKFAKTLEAQESSKVNHCLETVTLGINGWLLAAQNLASINSKICPALQVRNAESLLLSFYHSAQSPLRKRPSQFKQIFIFPADLP